ncbi:MAG: hypothetical protein QME58_12435 [Bacteroidota bacterium]|nr:hypothetical protein [Bacteroidota bacterium]
MKFKGRTYAKRINELKSLRHIDRPEYYKLMAEIEKCFGISVKTIYRDMNKPVPGLRKVRSDRGALKNPITKNELAIAEEIMKSGKTIKKTRKVIEAKTNKKVSTRKMQKIRTEAAKQKGSRNSLFGNEARKFFEKLFEYELIAPGRGVEMKYEDVSFIVNKEDLRDVIMILTNAYNRAVLVDDKKLQLDRNQMRKVMLHHLIEDQMRIAAESADGKLVESLTRMIDRLEVEQKIDVNFEVLENICKSFKPEITRSDVVELVKKQMG